MIEVILAGIVTGISILNTLSTILLWKRYAEYTGGIISLVNVDKNGDVKIHSPFLSSRSGKL